MANKYTKLTKETFIQRVKDGTYDNDVAAKRGLGRAALSANAKKACLEAIEKHFKDNKGKKTGKKKKATKAKASTKKGSSKKKVAARKPKREPQTRTESYVAVQPHHMGTWDADLQDKLAQVHLAREQIGTTAQAIAAMQQAKEVYPDLDVKEGSEASQRIITHAVGQLENTIETVSKDNGTSSVLSAPAPFTTTENQEPLVEIPTVEDVAESDGGE